MNAGILVSQDHGVGVKDAGANDKTPLMIRLIVGTATDDRPVGGNDDPFHLGVHHAMIGIQINDPFGAADFRIGPRGIADGEQCSFARRWFPGKWRSGCW